ncbi:MAG: hypothetical protein V8T66_06190 [Phocaeicola sp.]|uniref:hypothetical protein n=1 Tax=Phocaeicola sp. TaxID=2773926 RepID=UPI00300F0226
MRICLSFLMILGVIYPLWAQQVDYSIVSVQEESGIEFTPITSASDYVCMPIVRRSSMSLDWLSNRILDISRDGTHIAYLSCRNNTTNIFIKELNKKGGAVQRTNRSDVYDFSYSPDGKYICFSEQRGNENQIFQTSASNGYVCRQLTSGNRDFSPVYSLDMNMLLFTRQENRGASIWSYNVKNNFLSSYSAGMNPCPVKGESAYFCVRANSSGKSEIWKINYESGVETCIVSDPSRNFTSPILSPDGRWLLFVGESAIQGSGFTYRNTDLFVCHVDGTGFAQLTYHAADDLSPVWSKDGRFIYFISQRGSADGTANIWKMNFNY